MNPTTDWHILGAGSIGCLWASKLLKNRQQPTIIVRQDKYQPNRILKLTDLAGSEHAWPVNTVSPDTLTQPIDRLIVCTKAQDALNAIQPLSDQFAEYCQIILMQNGMGSQQHIADIFSDHAVFAASTTEGAWMKKPFSVHHAGKGNTWLGAMNDKARQQKSCDLTELSDSIFPVSNIEEKLWDKLAINCAINGLTALYNCRNGELLESTEIKNRLDQLIGEVIKTRQALHLNSSPDLFETVYQVCTLTAANYSSTCVDVQMGRKTELSYINGYLLQQAGQLQLQLPANQQLMDDLRQAGVRW